MLSNIHLYVDFNNGFRRTICHRNRHSPAEYNKKSRHVALGSQRQSILFFLFDLHWNEKAVVNRILNDRWTTSISEKITTHASYNITIDLSANHFRVFPGVNKVNDLSEAPKSMNNYQGVKFTQNLVKTSWL